MKISILCSSSDHPVNEYLNRWIRENEDEHTITLVRTVEELTNGDLLFLISCTQILKREHRQHFQKCLVIHASDLPAGRGWSPHIWEILNGAEKITVTLLEAEDSVDSGSIWKKEVIHVPATDLYDEINKKLFQGELDLMTFAVENFGKVEPSSQGKAVGEHYRKRTPADSEVDINKPLVSQLNLIRVADPNRFPAFFYYKGVRFKITLQKD